VLLQWSQTSPWAPYQQGVPKISRMASMAQEQLDMARSWRSGAEGGS
jgi:hypothetical protein